MNPIIARYKIPLLISLVIAVGMIAFRAESNWLGALYIMIGSILGFIILDLEFPAYAYIMDPSSEKSLKIKELIRSKSLKEFYSFINANEYFLGELSLRSVFFQVAFSIFAIYVFTTARWVLPQALSLSILVNLFYSQIIELSHQGTLKRWFWIYNGEISKQLQSVYIVIMAIVILFVFTLI